MFQLCDASVTRLDQSVVKRGKALALGRARTTDESSTVDRTERKLSRWMFRLSRMNQRSLQNLPG